MGLRGAVLALLLTWACGGGGGGAGADSGVAVCEPVGELGGAAFALSWSCRLGCDSDAPFQYLDRVEIGDDLRYLRDECEGCAPVIDDYVEDGECLAATGIPLGDGRRSDAYEICPTECGAAANVAFSGRPGPETQSVWRMTATPLP